MCSPVTTAHAIFELQPVAIFATSIQLFKVIRGGDFLFPDFGDFLYITNGELVPIVHRVISSQSDFRSLFSMWKYGRKTILAYSLLLGAP